MPNDHNWLRSNSFQDVLNKLLSIKDLLEYPEYQLNICYNMHHGNINELNKFLDLLKEYELECNVYVSNIVNYPENSFINLLSEYDYQVIYINEVVPLLLQYGYKVEDILPRYGLERNCDALNMLNIKFYSNGNTSLCSFFDKNNNLIYDTGCKDISDLPQMCVFCYDYPTCGGIRPCIQCGGKYEYSKVTEMKIRKYLELREMGYV
jgi:hypothetical protein